MKNLKKHLDTLSLKDEAVLEDFLALKYRMTKDELLLESGQVLQDPDLLKILERSYYAKAQKYFNENLFNYAREENNASNAKVISEKYQKYLDRTKNSIVGSLQDPYDSEAFKTSLNSLFEGIDLESNPEIQAIREDIEELYASEYLTVDKGLVKLFNEAYKELEDGNMDEFLDATQDLPDEDKDQIFNMAMRKMPMDDKLNMAVNYLDMSDVQDIGPEVSDMADTIKNSRLDQGESAKAISNLIGQITDNPKEAHSILGSLSDDTLDLLSQYLGSEYPDNSDTQSALRLEEGETEAFSDHQSYDDSPSEKSEPQYLPDPFEFEDSDHENDENDENGEGYALDDNDDADDTSLFQDDQYKDGDSDSDFE